MNREKNVLWTEPDYARDAFLNFAFMFSAQTHTHRPIPFTCLVWAIYWVSTRLASQSWAWSHLTSHATDIDNDKSYCVAWRRTSLLTWSVSESLWFSNFVTQTCSNMPNRNRIRVYRFGVVNCSMLICTCATPTYELWIDQSNGNKSFIDSTRWTTLSSEMQQRSWHRHMWISTLHFVWHSKWLAFFIDHFGRFNKWPTILASNLWAEILPSWKQIYANHVYLIIIIIIAVSVNVNRAL